MTSTRLELPPTVVTRPRSPPLLSPAYGSTTNRAPLRPPVAPPLRLTEVTGPVLGEDRVGALDADLTRQHDGEPSGQRIIVSGRVLDGDGRPVPARWSRWQPNAASRYRHVAAGPERMTRSEIT